MPLLLLLFLLLSPPVAADPLVQFNDKIATLTQHAERLEQFREWHYFYNYPCDTTCDQNYNTQRLVVLRTLQEGSALRAQLVTDPSATAAMIQWETLAKRVNTLLLVTARR
ncbi:hypothetical protein [Candidatus Cyanaurora vandensis]|uniref:hypothetical protein n=1 Tax=Candidatus Cyanaurora vandensis TaxID=2714958 RepID=UPI00257E66E9|nr:hypothetical protein [Candidatus Cyanaurora vandensis]